MSLKFAIANPELIGEVLTRDEKKGFIELNCTEPSLTKQEYKDECDIARIVDTYTRTGFRPYDGAESVGLYADVSELPDYKSSLEYVIAARDSFSQMPIHVKRRFHNNPQELLTFLKDENNREEAEKLGLVEKRQFKSPPPKEPEPEPAPSK